MGSSTVLEELSEGFRFIPFEGHVNEFVIASKLPPGGAEKEMTPEDWDKFEKDIEDAFEQIP